MQVFSRARTTPDESVTDGRVPGLPAPRRIVIMRATPGMGDMLCAVPAFRALRTAFPRAHIALITVEWLEPLVRRYTHYIDELIPFPGYPGIPELGFDVCRLPAFFASMHARNFDLAIQMHGNGSISNPFTILLGAKLNAGWYQPGAYCPDQSLFLPYVDDEHEICRQLRLLAHLGIPHRGYHLEFPLYGSDFEELGAITEAACLREGEYVCLHPGATEPARRWCPGSFAAVGDALARQGLQIVLTGTSTELGLAQAVAGAMRSSALNLAGRTGLGTLAALLSRARLVVCNDTGVSHLAAALRVPSVVLFTTTSPERWAPLDSHLHRVVLTSPVADQHRHEHGPQPERTHQMQAVRQVLHHARNLLSTRTERLAK